MSNLINLSDYPLLPYRKLRHNQFYETDRAYKVYKICRYDTIVTLILPEGTYFYAGDRKAASQVIAPDYNTKMRADQAIVACIETSPQSLLAYKGKFLEEISSYRDRYFIYRVNDLVVPYIFPSELFENLEISERFSCPKGCSTGIHFFCTKQGAKEYKL